MLKFFFDGGEQNGSVVIRPSGTEPKLKAYISISANSKDNAISIEETISNEIKERLGI